MGVHLKEYELDDGSIVTIADVMKKTGIKKGAARRRLTFSNSREEIMVEKSVRVRADVPSAKRYVKKSIAEIKEIEKEVIRVNKKKYDKFIIENKPFYADENYRLMLKTISFSTSPDYN